MEIKQFLDWVRANGVDFEPAIEKADGILVVGYVPPTYLVWRKANGSKLNQGFNVIAESDDPVSYLWEVQQFFDLPKAVHVSWQDFLNPKQVVDLGDPPIPGTDAVVGGPFDIAKRLFYVKAGGVVEGARYNMPNTNRRFVAVVTGLFSIHWKEL